MPRFSARRRIPAQAFAVNENRCGTPPVSKISDNEHTAASLRDSVGLAACSDILSVKHSVCEPIPELPQAPEEGSKIPSSAAGQDARDILPEEPAGAIAVSDGKIGEHEVAARVSQPLAEACDGEGLTGCASDKNIDICIGPLLELRHVAPIRDVGVMVGEDR